MEALKFPRTQVDWSVWYCRGMALFALQGVIILAIYATRGFGTSPDAMPPGLKLDPLHGVIHLVTGFIGGYLGFRRPGSALRFLQGFTIFYLSLAVIGTFTAIRFGMQLEIEENVFHWSIGGLAAVIAFGPSLLGLFRKA